jgi:hypothetical protein
MDVHGYVLSYHAATSLTNCLGMEFRLGHAWRVRGPNDELVMREAAVTREFQTTRPIMIEPLRFPVAIQSH